MKSYRKGTEPQRKRRYRLRRYLAELHYLRPVTSDVLQRLHTYAPKSANESCEVICFTVDSPRTAHYHRLQERLVVVAFGHDGTCYVVDLGSTYSDEDRVDEMRHNIDFAFLKHSIARRQRKCRIQTGNTLSAQLLIRFISDINNRIPPLELGRSAWGGPYNVFKCAQKWFNAAYSPPDPSIVRQLTRSLNAIVRTDSQVSPSRTYQVIVDVRKETRSRIPRGNSPVAEEFAEYEVLHDYLLRGGPLTSGSRFTGSPSLLTERFVALAWCAFNEHAADRLIREEWEDVDSDECRFGGCPYEFHSWPISLRVPSARSRTRSNNRFRKWLKGALAHFEKDLALEIQRYENHAKRSERREAARQRLLAWATLTWRGARQQEVADLEDYLDSDRLYFLSDAAILQESVNKQSQRVRVLLKFGASSIEVE
jgi:hypothetical protein